MSIGLGIADHRDRLQLSEVFCFLGGSHYWRHHANVVDERGQPALFELCEHRAGIRSRGDDFVVRAFSENTFDGP